MSGKFQRIKNNGYAPYLTLKLDQDAAVTSEIRAEDLGDLTNRFAAYVSEGSAGQAKWLGAQAADWGLDGTVLDGAILGLVLDHRDPSGVDLDFGRIARGEKLVLAQKKYEAETERWAKLGGTLGPKADLFDVAAERLKEGMAPSEVAALLEPLFGKAGAAEAQKFTVLSVTKATEKLEKLRKTRAATVDPKEVLRVEKQISAAEIFLISGAAAVTGLRAGQSRRRCVRPVKPKVDTTSTSAEVVAYDLTLSAPKSVSLLLAAAVAEGRTDILDGIIQEQQFAAASAFAVVEEELSALRRGKGGRDREALEVGLVGAAVPHFTSRPSNGGLTDPHLHTHTVISALAKSSSDGKWMTVDSRTWMQSTASVTAVYERELRSRLTARFGVKWRERTIVNDLGKTVSTWEVDLGSSAEAQDDLITEFSNRDTEIREEMQEQAVRGERPSHEKAHNATKNKKEGEGVLSEKLSDEWKDRLQEADLPAGALLEQALFSAEEETVKRQAERPTRARLTKIHERVAAMSAEERGKYMRTNTTIGEVRKLGEELANGRGHFTRADLLRAAYRNLDGGIPAFEIEAAADIFLDHEAELVSGATVGDPTGWAVEARWSCTNRVKLEKSAVSHLQKLVGKSWGGVKNSVQQEVLSGAAERGVTLNPDQEALFRAATSGSYSAVFGVAPPGAGKSTVAALVARAIAKSDKKTRFFSLAPASRAGTELGEDIKIELSKEDAKLEVSGSLERYFKLLDLGKLQVKKGDVIVLDEVSQCRLSDIDRLLKIAAKEGARVLMFGDDQQLQAVGEAGGLLNYVREQGGEHVIELSQIVRAKTGPRKTGLETWHTGLSTGDRQLAERGLQDLFELGQVKLNRGSVEACVLEAVDLFEQMKGEAATRALEWDEHYFADWDARSEGIREACAAAKKGRDPEEIRAAEAAKAKHERVRQDHVAGDISIVATTHAEAAMASDEIFRRQVERGEISDSVTAIGKRFNSKGEDLTGPTGEDLSKSVFAKGIGVRVTKNGSSRFDDAAFEARMAEAATAERVDRLLKQAARKREAASKMGNPDLARRLLKEAKDLEKRSAEAFSPDYRTGYGALARTLSEEGLSAAKPNLCRNGDIGEVQTVHEDGSVTVRFGSGLIRFGSEELEQARIVPAAGGARTVDSSQGATYDFNVFLAASGATNSASALVGMSRARYDSIAIFGGTQEDVDGGKAYWRSTKRDTEMKGELFATPEPTDDQAQWASTLPKLTLSSADTFTLDLAEGELRQRTWASAEAAQRDADEFFAEERFGADSAQAVAVREKQDETAAASTRARETATQQGAGLTLTRR